MRGGARQGAGKKPTQFDHARAIKLKKEGFTYDQIAARFGISVYVISWFFRKQREKATHTSNQNSSQE